MLFLNHDIGIKQMLRANVILHEIDLDDYDITEINIKGKPSNCFDISDETKVIILDNDVIKNNAIIDSKKGILYHMKHREYASKL